MDTTTTNTSSSSSSRDQQFSKQLPNPSVASSVPSLLSLSLKDNPTNTIHDLSMKPPPLQNTDQPFANYVTSSPSSFGESRNIHNHQIHTLGAGGLSGTGSASPHRSPSLHANGSGSLASLQAVPEDAELATVDSVPNFSASSVSSTSLQSGRRLSASYSSDMGSEETANSPVLNISVQGHEIPHTLFVALRHRADEMRELYERNAPLFDQITSCVLSSTRHTPPSTNQTKSDSSPTPAADESPLTTFLDLLFAPREQVPDRVWMKSLEGYLSGAPALLETFRELVGYEPEDNDVLLDGDDMGISGMPWLPECEDDQDSDTEEGEGSISDSPEEVHWKNGMVKEFIDIESDLDTGDLKTLDRPQGQDYLKSSGLAV